MLFFFLIGVVFFLIVGFFFCFFWCGDVVVFIVDCGCVFFGVCDLFVNWLGGIVEYFFVVMDKLIKLIINDKVNKEFFK